MVDVSCQRYPETCLMGKHDSVYTAHISESARAPAREMLYIVCFTSANKRAFVLNETFARRGQIFHKTALLVKHIGLMWLRDAISFVIIVL